MKVLQINSVYGFGSTGKIVADIHQNCLNKGIESYVIYSRNQVDNNQMKNVYRFYDALGFYKHVILGVLFDKHGLYSKNNTKKIINKIEEINPDIVHIHNIHGFYCNYPMLLDYLKNKKVIWTLHDCWAYTGFCAHYDYNECCQWRENKCVKCKYRNNYPYRVLSHSKENFKIKEEIYKQLNPILVTPSKWLKDELSNSMLHNKTCRVVNNAVNLADFFQEKNEEFLLKYHLNEKKIYLTVSNYWTKQKGFEEYMKLSKLLNDNEVIVMIGCSRNQLNKLPKNIIGFSRVDKNELRKWYSNAAAFVNLTLEDNYPTVNLEAQACGLPVFTYKSGGSTEMVKNKEYICEKYNINQMIELVRNDSLINQHNNIKLENNENRMFLEYYAIYEELYKTNNQ
ncbi:MAG: glycosyltransferase [Erysipelotrichales bacterium]|nr:glycosyltransferase [Erysipelotrichales bacterium]